MAKGSRQLKVTFLIIPLFIVFIAAVFCSFLFGIHWQETLGMKKLNDNSIEKLLCFGDNNFTETFQYNCYSPITTPFKGFTSHLECRVLTNLQMNSQSSKYNELMTIKADYIKFSLNFSKNMTLIEQSLQPGEPVKELYKIVENNENIIHGIRNTRLDDFHAEEYEFITLSKKTGKGMVSWIYSQDNLNSDNIALEFFQCN